MPHMESQKLDAEISIRLHSETLKRLRELAKTQRRKLCAFLRLALEDVANAEK